MDLLFVWLVGVSPVLHEWNKTGLGWYCTKLVQLQTRLFSHWLDFYSKYVRLIYPANSFVIATVFGVLIKDLEDEHEQNMLNLKQINQSVLGILAPTRTSLTHNTERSNKSLEIILIFQLQFMHLTIFCSPYPTGLWWVYFRGLMGTTWVPLNNPVCGATPWQCKITHILDMTASIKTHNTRLDRVPSQWSWKTHTYANSHFHYMWNLVLVLTCFIIGFCIV